MFKNNSKDAISNDTDKIMCEYYSYNIIIENDTNDVKLMLLWI